MRPSSEADRDNAAAIVPRVSVVIPCLNEARTLADCIRRASWGLEIADLVGEIIVADNGSDDRSAEIAIEHRASVVHVPRRGYGSALLGGIAAARGRYVVMADADGSYDFGAIPSFIAKLDEGYDLVIGNRFAGEIKRGAMPWHHRYIGNPVLSGIGRLLFRPGCRDFHCGLRAFDRGRIGSLNLRCPGMEFASEMIIMAASAGMRIAEVPITLYPDGRERAPHLRSFRDGWRHLRLMASLRIQRRVAPQPARLY